MSFRRKWRHITVVVVLAMALVIRPVGGRAIVVADAASSGASTSGWVVESSPSVGSYHNELKAVAFAGASQFAVGDYYTGVADQTLVEQSLGGAWRVVPSPNASANHNELDAVSGTSASDIWAVGRFVPPSGQELSLAMHWNGHRWTIVNVARQGSFHNELDGVVALSSKSAWAVGHVDTSQVVSDQALIEHWDGTKWSAVRGSRSVGQYSGLRAIGSAPGGTQLWAVGYQSTGSLTRTLIERRVGATWSVVTSPNIGPSTNDLFGVTVVSVRDAWAVGQYFVGTVAHALVEHWNGVRWSIVSTPPIPSHHYVLAGVASSTTGRSMAVGDYFAGQADLTMVLVQSGGHWVIEKSPNASAGHNALEGVAGSPKHGFVAVGLFYNGQADRTLIERCQC